MTMIALRSPGLWLERSLELGMADVQIHDAESYRHRQGSVPRHTYKCYSEAMMRPR
ncbi:hypothetical protein P691DRAFT_800655 [Macrolepiota fuliginosa MF-IS2]|uniref:Uncharacterized protein n=1 Tax=Macrolepiota fuliginosa MF-IS2 TaxID=1400762 RepID=A0A9P5XCK2_9AGAR|nr:hypothetical protein P691DRAFT_800655 [Macrolepiota fuliginosa MF-IS2]